MWAGSRQDVAHGAAMQPACRCNAACATLAAHTSKLEHIPSTGFMLAAPYRLASVHKQRRPELARHGGQGAPGAAVFGCIDGRALGAAPLWKVILDEHLGRRDRPNKQACQPCTRHALWGAAAHASRVGKQHM